MGYVWAFVAVFFWSWNIIVANRFAYLLSPYEIAFGRWLIASVILLVLYRHQLRQSLKELTRHKILVLSMALTGIVFDNTLIYFAGKTVSAFNIGLLGIIGPIFLVALSAVFLKTRITKQQFAGMAVTIVGVLVIISRGKLSDFATLQFGSGDFIVIVNTVCFAVYSLLQSLRPRQISQAAMLTASSVAGTIVLFAMLLTFESLSELQNLTAIDLGVIAYLGVFNSVIAYLAWNVSLAEIGNLKAGIVYYFLPIFSGAEGYLLLHQPIYAAEIWGGIIVIVGVLIVNLSRQSANSYPPTKTNS